MLNYIQSYFYKEEETENLSEYFPDRILDIVGENNLKGNKIEWNSLWMGYTDYIDRIRSNELTQKFSYGVDHYNRSFIFVKIDEQTVIVIFQRYSDDKSRFVAINPDGKIDSDVIRGRCYIDKEFRQVLKDYISSH